MITSHGPPILCSRLLRSARCNMNYDKAGEFCSWSLRHLRSVPLTGVALCLAPPHVCLLTSWNALYKYRHGNKSNSQIHAWNFAKEYRECSIHCWKTAAAYRRIPAAETLEVCCYETLSRGGFRQAWISFHEPPYGGPKPDGTLAECSGLLLHDGWHRPYVSFLS